MFMLIKRVNLRKYVVIYAFFCNPLDIIIDGNSFESCNFKCFSSFNNDSACELIISLSSSLFIRLKS